jgi:hypothetical protein
VTGLYGLISLRDAQCFKVLGKPVWEAAAYIFLIPASLLIGFNFLCPRQSAVATGQVERTREELLLDVMTDKKAIADPMQSHPPRQYCLPTAFDGSWWRKALQQLQLASFWI